MILRLFSRCSQKCVCIKSLLKISGTNGQALYNDFDWLPPTSVNRTTGYKYYVKEISPPAGYKATDYVYEFTASTTAVSGVADITYEAEFPNTPFVPVRIRKTTTSGYSDWISNNSCYSLTGTQFAVYDNQSYANANTVSKRVSFDIVDASGNVFYTVSFVNTFNAAGQLIQRDQMTTPDADGNSYAFIRITRTYNADGTVATENQNYLNADGTPMESNWYKIVYYYNADGTIDHYRQQSNSRYGDVTYDYVYTYATYDAAYVVKNVKAVAGANNMVSLSWDAVDGATSYNVIYDQQVISVEGTEYVTETLLDGSHDFYVQAVVGGEGKNISTAAAAAVKDTGKLPAQNFTILSVEEGETEWGSVAYNVTIQFNLPETSSTITGYKLCYGDGNWDNVSFGDPTVEDGKVTATVQLGQYSVSDYDSETYEYVPRSEVALSVVITYATGDAERSNTKSWNFADNVPLEEPEPSPYDIDGDGVLTVSDITALIDIYLNLGSK